MAWVGRERRFSSVEVEAMRAGGRQELLEDFRSLVTTFAGRLYGMRSADARRRLPAESGQYLPDSDVR